MNNIKNKRNVLLLVIISLGVLYFTLKDNFNEVIDNIININIWWLLASLFLVFGYWLFRAIAYKDLIDNFDPDYNFKRAFGLTMLTQFFNGITPFSSGGQPFVIYTLKKDGINASNGTNIIVQDFIAYQTALIIIGTIAIVYNQIFHIFREIPFLKDVVTIGYLVNLSVMLGLFVFSFAKKMNKYFVNFLIKLLCKLRLVKYKDRALEIWDERINAFHNGALILSKDKTFFIRLVMYHIVSLVSFYLVPLTLIYGMGDYTSITGHEAIFTTAYIFLVGAFIPVPGSTGGLEFTFFAFFSNFITGTMLGSVMLLWRFLTYYLGVFIGTFVFYIWKRRS
jgi:glycosyltransferase 2 family protein